MMDRWQDQSCAATSLPGTNFLSYLRFFVAVATYLTETTHGGRVSLESRDQRAQGRKGCEESVAAGE